MSHLSLVISENRQNLPVAHFTRDPFVFHRKYRPANTLAADLCTFKGVVALKESEINTLRRINQFWVEIEG